MKKIAILFCLLTLLISCFSRSSSDPKDVFEYWIGDVPNNFEILQGEYYQSPHFTLEYEVFLKFKPTKEWWFAFKKQNNLIDVTATDDEDNWTSFASHLDWFNPDDNFTVYAASDYDWNRSRYFIDYENGICYVYETLGM